MKNYENVVIFDHPLIKHKIAILRDERTSTKEFRELVEEITTLMTYECLKDGVPTIEVDVKTPLETCKQQVVKDNAVAIVPILRAGLGMVNGIHVLFPLAKVGHIGMYLFSGILYYFFFVVYGDNNGKLHICAPLFVWAGSTHWAGRCLHGYRRDISV